MRRERGDHESPGDATGRGDLSNANRHRHTHSRGKIVQIEISRPHDWQWA